MAKNSTPIKPQKARKIAAGPEWWPPEYEAIYQCWALEAIHHGNGSILARYLRGLDEIDPRVRRGLAETLNPASNHFWRLHARYRFPGTPTKWEKELQHTFIAAVVPLAKLLSGTDSIDAQCHRTVAEMLDPGSRHPLRLDFKQRNSGRPPLESPRTDWPPLLPGPIQRNPAMVLAEKRIREATKSGRKVPLKQLHDGISRATFFRRKALFRNRNKTAVRLRLDRQNNKTKFLIP
jgi:hypothetical protein